MSDELIEEWVGKGEMDFQAALDLARRRKERLPDKVVYDCAQCAEKYLKAFLTRHQHPYRKRHDLLELEVFCLEVDSDIQLIHDSLTTLNKWISDVRYPGLSAGIEDAEEAIKVVKQVRKFVRKKLGLK